MRQLSLPLLSQPMAAPPAETRAPALDAGQLIRPGSSAAFTISSHLSSLLREPVEVELTDNAWTMVSYRRIDGRLRFRLHHMFACATDDVMHALASFTGKGRRTSGRTIDEYVRRNRHLIKQSSPRPEAPLAARGRVHDLADIFNELNARYFENGVVARIGWGRRSPQGRRRSIKMGVYFHEQKLIRLHPALDDERVPRHFVEMVVFHEMLHQVFPPTQATEGRRCVHGPDFRAAERRFPGYDRARAWERSHLHLLLRQRS